MRKREIPSSRERVRLALEHQVTDRIPIAMVCSGINPPARWALEAYLQVKAQDLSDLPDRLVPYQGVRSGGQIDYRFLSTSGR